MSSYPRMNSSYFSLHLLLKITVICKDLHLQLWEEKKIPSQKQVFTLIREPAMKGDYGSEKLENIYFGEEANMEIKSREDKRTEQGNRLSHWERTSNRLTNSERT